ncbi:acyl carrier protein [Affinibrenneria salicis]|uniref:Acyl carrier protein n=1 Tax=Affinibrenneria salicis TaxID=2590031 RepID=A0A5J5FQE2_9GAMM|nr:acyl carrier protein [Affinibrenneria salicis]KAA8995161.1 acyl carrier protein [Affinibrenneria salicis]
MDIQEFIDFINSRSGMQLKPEHADIDLANLDEWDSLTFVYMIMAFESEKNIDMDIEKILQCTNLRDLCKVVNNEVEKNS